VENDEARMTNVVICHSDFVTRYDHRPKHL
jgi:hypothetical protein